MKEDEALILLIAALAINEGNPRLRGVINFNPVRVQEALELSNPDLVLEDKSLLNNAVCKLVRNLLANAE